MNILVPEKIIKNGLPDSIMDAFGISVKRGKAKFIDRSKGCPNTSEMIDDSYVVYLECFDKDGNFIGHPGIEIGLRTDRKKIEEKYSGFYFVREANELGAWGPNGFSLENIDNATKSESDTIRLLGEKLKQEYSDCRKIIEELEKMGNSNVFQTIVSGYCLPSLSLQDQAKYHKSWIAEIRSIIT